MLLLILSGLFDSLLTWQTQLNKESGATIVIHTYICFLSKTIKSTRVAHVPSSEALLQVMSSYTYANAGRAMSQLLTLGGSDQLGRVPNSEGPTARGNSKLKRGTN